MPGKNSAQQDSMGVNWTGGRSSVALGAVRSSPNNMEKPMTALRVDFKHVREHADFLKILAAYDIEAHKDGSKAGQFKALCPFHKDTKPSLKVNTSRNIYHCFSCEAKGNVLDFVMAMDDLGKEDIRQAAVKVAELSHCTLTENGGNAPSRKGKRRQHRDGSDPSPATPETPKDLETPAAGDAENKELSFALQMTMPGELIAWLDAHGIDQSVAETFGLGLVSNRSKTIALRLGIPLHNKDGKLIGYAGRYLGDDEADNKPKYVLPKGFRKELELFNLNRFPLPCPYVVLFESYLSVMRHHGHIPCVSAFGRSISSRQIELLKGLGCQRLIIVFDGDEPGHTGAAVAAGAIAPHLWVRSITLPENVKPHHLDWPGLRPHLEAVWPKKIV
jgi:DNA primase